MHACRYLANKTLLYLQPFPCPLTTAKTKDSMPQEFINEMHQRSGRADAEAVRTPAGESGCMKGAGKRRFIQRHRMHVGKHSGFV